MAELSIVCYFTKNIVKIQFSHPALTVMQMVQTGLDEVIK